MKEKIVSIKIDDNQITIKTKTSSGALHTMILTDDMRLCCENRYFRTDDDVADYIGDYLTGIDVRLLNDRDYKNQRDVAFLHITTDKGVLVVQAYNEHNGYYEGFGVSIEHFYG